MREYDAAWNKFDAKTVALLFSEDANLVNRSGIWSKGRSEIEQHHKRLLTTVFQNSEPITHTVASVRFITPEVAVVHTTLDTKDKLHRSITTWVMDKTASGWKIFSMSVNDTRPLSQPK